MEIEVIYIGEQQQTLIKCTIPVGTTIEQAFMQHSVYDLIPEAKTQPIGIFSKKVSLHTVLKEGDRVEIYRALTRDPKDRRRALAKNKR